mmetsp:Transcript_82/g.239  ORF Transcript_82/g.239 Transcript_82/m.239 type:complete len:915 (-) Transcript_82:41-2785(-)
MGQCCSAPQPLFDEYEDPRGNKSAKRSGSDSSWAANPLAGADVPALEVSRERNSRAVRRRVSEAQILSKRRQAIAAAREEEGVSLPERIPKSAEETSLIMRAVADSILFTDVSDEATALTVELMSPISFGPNEDIIVQGDEEDVMFYVLAEGSCEALVDDKSVMVYDAGSCFGELALLYQCPRKATVRSLSPVRLWQLSQGAFKRTLHFTEHAAQEQRLDQLMRVNILHPLDESHLGQLVEKLEPRSFEAGEVVFRKGDVGDAFYIVTEGDLIITDDEQTLQHVTTGSHFGELALLTNEPRAGTVTAQTRVETLVLCQKDFVQHLGPLGEAWRIASMHQTELLGTLTTVQLQQLANKLVPMTFSADEVIFEQGEQGDTYYVIEHGTVSVEVVDDGVAPFTKTLTRGDGFGELALLRKDVRSATVRTSTKCRLLALTLPTFELVLGSLEELELGWRMKQLLNVEMFHSLDDTELYKIARVMNEKTFADGEFVFRAGEPGNDFFVIESGAVEILGVAMNELTTLATGQFLGELALLNDDVRSANARAKGRATLLSLNRDAFEVTLGSMKDLMEKRASSKYVASRMSLTSSARVECELKDLELRGILGMGSFGRVSLVRYEHNYYALKQMAKDHIVRKNLVNVVKREKNVMAQCHSPFLVNLCASYKDPLYVYLLMEVVLGGEVFVYLQSQSGPPGTGGIPENHAKFFIACVVLGFEYLHSHNIAYRDLKPENMLFCTTGYVKITDFSFAKKIPPGRKSYTLCGTPAYLAPEQLSQVGHSWSVDWWCVGVLIYELLVNVPPFIAADELRMYKKIKEVQYKWTTKVSANAKDITSKLLKKSPSARLGYGGLGVAAVKKHKWFADIDWAAMQRQSLPAPYLPSVTGPEDLSHFYDVGEEEIPGGARNGRYQSRGRFNDF